MNSSQSLRLCFPLNWDRKNSVFHNMLYHLTPKKIHFFANSLTTSEKKFCFPSFLTSQNPFFTRFRAVSGPFSAPRKPPFRRVFGKSRKNVFKMPRPNMGLNMKNLGCECADWKRPDRQRKQRKVLPIIYTIIYKFKRSSSPC